MWRLTWLEVVFLYATVPAGKDTRETGYITVINQTSVLMEFCRDGKAIIITVMFPAPHPPPPLPQFFQLNSFFSLFLAIPEMGKRDGRNTITLGNFRRNYYHLFKLIVIGCQTRSLRGVKRITVGGWRAVQPRDSAFPLQDSRLI